VNSVLEDLPGHTNFVIGDLLNELDHVEEKISTYSRQIAEIAKTNEQVKNLMKLPGIGVVTATAMVATIGNAYEFKSGRQLSAWLGLTPRQNSSGGKARLGKITKTGDGYIRKMLVMGAKSILLQAEKREDSVSQWAKELRARRGYGKALLL
jgi:transposase